MCISKCVMARAQILQTMIAIHSFVQSEANTQRTKNFLLSWEIFSIASSGSQRYDKSIPTQHDSPTTMRISKEAFQKMFHQ